MSDDWQRRPWTEGPDEEAPPASFLKLEDDELLHRIQTLGEENDEDERLLEVVASDRHFFIRQEAAKRVRDRSRLFAFEEDRHVGQILVRHLTRREDMTYLERLSTQSRHVEVRSAAQVQLARLWRRLDGPREAGGLGGGFGAPQDTAVRVPPAPASPALVSPDPAPPDSVPILPDPVRPASASPAPVSSAPVRPAPAPPPPPPPEPVTSAPLEKGGVDGSLLAWAAHFVVEQAWSRLGTKGSHDLLTQTRRELLGRHPTLVLFEITRDAHVLTNLDAGPRLPGDSVRAVAAWMVAYRAAARELDPALERTSIRAATAMLADALRGAGFYAACDEEEALVRP